MPEQIIPAAALRWPEDFPPASKWKRFLLGVRWLGPDLTFLRQLRKRQAARTPDLMKEWGCDHRRCRTAEIFGRAFQRHLRWPTAMFLPGDEFRAIAFGPRVSLVDHGDLEAAVQEAEQKLEGRAPDEFWVRAQDMTLGDVVDAYLQLAGSSVVRPG